MAAELALSFQSSESRAEEHALILAAQTGDRAAFGRLYERYARMVHGIALSYVQHSDVQDIVQDVFLQAMERLPSLRLPEAFGGWLGAIARNTALDAVRRRRPTDELPHQLPAPRSSHDGQLDAAHAALDKIRKLPEAYRETLVLRLVEGLTGPEIARQTGLTPDSVRVNLHRGMKLLREQLREWQ
ncbi:MAG: sigma-70 family RNA polymerase sigma factor [Bryobacterales bacterium]|nr:sigma-70 family RNA polymerase sigma factor [Bryobacterales bacterium]